MSRYGNFLQTYSGVKFYPFDPRKDEILIEDIIKSLPKICRYTGNTKKFYSVAEHSVIMALEFPEHAKLALLHDAAEAYFGDIPSPIKKMIPEFSCREDVLLNKIFEKFGLGSLDGRKERIIKEMDLYMLYIEKNSEGIMSGHDEIIWNGLENYKTEKPLSRLIGWNPKDAERYFKHTIEKTFDIKVHM